MRLFFILVLMTSLVACEAIQKRNENMSRTKSAISEFIKSHVHYANSYKELGFENFAETVSVDGVPVTEYSFQHEYELKNFSGEVKKEVRTFTVDSIFNVVEIMFVEGKCRTVVSTDWADEFFRKDLIEEWSMAYDRRHLP